LSESLEQQTANVGGFDRHQPPRPANCSRFFQKMLENATRICGANFGMMGLFDEDCVPKLSQCTNAPARVRPTPSKTRKFQPHPESGA